MLGCCDAGAGPLDLAVFAGTPTACAARRNGLKLRLKLRLKILKKCLKLRLKILKKSSKSARNSAPISSNVRPRTMRWA